MTASTDEKTPQSISPKWNADGLLPAIAQDIHTGEVLMMAWMNEESLALTLERKQAIYWSRSRQTLWRKGESSGNLQTVVDARLDCDGDTLLLKVDQAGVGACHTGRRTCFFYAPRSGQWLLEDE
jgi:phosphoribosyl-AMP cyclohydrolase